MCPKISFAPSYESLLKQNVQFQSLVCVLDVVYSLLFPVFFSSAKQIGFDASICVRAALGCLPFGLPGI